MEGTKMKRNGTMVGFLIVLLLLMSGSSVIFNDFFVINGLAGVGASDWHNTSSLSVYVYHYEPRITWYDIQYNDSGTWESRLNKKIIIDNSSEYRFIINISSDQGWDDIEFINLSAWFDRGNESSTYNQTKGGNFNLQLQYENTTSTGDAGVVRYFWPDEEVLFGSWSEIVVNDTIYGIPGLTEARNISFSFIPNCQFRYAPGNQTPWNTSRTILPNSSIYALNNKWSWNFNISVTDSGENTTSSLTTWVTDEFGVYSYSEILSAGNPHIEGFPGGNFSVNSVGGSGNVTVVTQSNGNYSLSVSIQDLAHAKYSGASIDNVNVFVRGGNRIVFRHLNNATYLYGGGSGGLPLFHTAEPNGIKKTTNDVEFKCYIPWGQLSGAYSTPIYYHLKTN
jgi:hypothetical protein